MCSRRLASVLTVVLAAIGSLNPAISCALTTNWQYDPSLWGAWEDDHNWTARVPTAADTATIANGGTAVVSTAAAAQNLYLGPMNLGDSRSGTVVQTGGSLAVGDTLFMADGASGQGYYRLNAGALTTRASAVGGYGLGEFLQSGGVHQALSLTLGGAGGARSEGPNKGRYELSGDGELSVTEVEVVGSHGTGEFIQFSGAHTAGRLAVALNSTEFGGTFELWGGTLHVTSEEIGVAGPGVFRQVGGEHTIEGDLKICWGLPPARPSGLFYLDGGSLSVGGNEYLGGTWQLGGLAQMLQSGGSHQIYGDLILAYDRSGPSLFELRGGSLLVGGDVVVGPDVGSRATFRVHGGLGGIQIDEDFVMGPFNEPNNTPQLSVLIDGTGLATIDVTGTAGLQGLLTVEFAPGFTPDFDQEFVVLRSSDGVSGSLVLAGPNAHDVELMIDSHSVILTSIVPEPSTSVLLSLAAAGLFVLAGHRRSQRERLHPIVKLLCVVTILGATAPASAQLGRRSRFSWARSVALTVGR